MTEQLVLSDLLLDPSPSFTNFIPGANQEIFSGLQRLSDGQAIYLWGIPASGKTHLLQALQQQHPEAHYYSAQHFPTELTHLPMASLYLIDDVDLLNTEQQTVLFNLYNTWQANKSLPQALSIVSSGSVAPILIPMREDLRNRLGWGLVYQLHPLSDEEARMALEKRAGEKGIQLETGVVQWIFNYYARDLRALMALLNGLDQYSVAHKRLITIPLIKSWLDSQRNKRNAV